MRSAYWLLCIMASTVVFDGCDSARPDRLDQAQRESVHSASQSVPVDAQHAKANGDAVLRSVDRKNFFDSTTIVSTFGSVKDERGNSSWLLNVWGHSKSVLNLKPGKYEVFVTCSSGPVFNNHLLNLTLAPESDTIVFCLPTAGRLFGMSTLAAFHVFAADADRFDEFQALYRKELASAGAAVTCGENCQERPIH